MPVSTLTSKGQITLPQAVRAALGLTAGDKLDFVAVDDGFKLVAVRQDVHTLRGRFAGRVNAPVSIEAMNEAVADEAAQRNAPDMAASQPDKQQAKQPSKRRTKQPSKRSAS